MPAYTEYQQYLRDCFAEAYRFIDTYKHARTDEDWARIVGSLEAYADPFTINLVVTAFTELEREYKEATNEQ